MSSLPGEDADGGCAADAGVAEAAEGEAMSALDELRELDDAASPGPLSTEKREPGHVCVRAPETGIVFCAVQREPEDFEMNEANAERAGLAHLLRPAFEALEKPERCLRQPDDETCLGMSEANQRWSGLCDRCAVFAQLEEALGRLC